MDECNAPNTDTVEQVKAHRVYELRINDWNIRYDVVTAYFITLNTLPPDRAVELVTGFTAHGERRVLRGVPTLVRFKTTIDRVLRFYRLEVRLPKA